MSNSPFAPEDTVNPTDSKETKTVTTTNPDSQAKIVTTLKGGSGYNAPWVVIHSDTPEEALNVLKNEDIRELLDQAKKVGEYFGGASQAGPKNANSQPVASKQPPANAPECPEGWEFKSGISKRNNKPWKGYFPPRGSNEKPIFF